MKHLVFVFTFVVLSSLCVHGGSILSKDESSYPFIFIAASVDASDLDNSGTFTLHTANTITSTYRILSIATTAGDSTSFTVGNRNLYIGTSSEQRWTMSASTLGSVGVTSYTMDNGISPAFNNNALSDTIAGEDIIIKHYGGALDYVLGSVVFHVVLFQTAA